MKNINLLLENDFKVGGHHSYQSEIELEIDDLFEALTAFFPAAQHQFSNEDALDSAKAMWCMALIADCNKTNTPINIKNGIRQATLLGSPFFPSVGEFIKLCHQVVTAEEAESAYLDYMGNIKNTNFLHVETRKLCGYDVKRCSSEAGKKLYIRTFQRVAIENPDKLYLSVAPALTDGTEQPEFGRASMHSADNSVNARINKIEYEKVHGLGSYSKHGRENGKYAGNSKGAPADLLKKLGL